MKKGVEVRPSNEERNNCGNWQGHTYLGQVWVRGSIQLPWGGKKVFQREKKERQRPSVRQKKGGKLGNNEDTSKIHSYQEVNQPEWGENDFFKT